MTINFNSDPYYDDYDEKKGFYKILFKPGLSVQARELTQLQTALQKQIERVGGSFYKDGSRVIGGEFGYSKDFRSIKLTSSFQSSSVDDYIDQLVGLDIVGEDSGVQANVVAVTISSATDAPTLYVSYTKTGDDKESVTFSASENLIAKFDTVNSITAGFPILTVAATNHTAVGQSASIQAGIYFIKGHFVYTAAQRIIISKYTNTESARVGLDVVESIVTATEDESLLDNAQGSPNFSARGADRYSIGLELNNYSLTESVDSFIELQRINLGRQAQSFDAVTNFNSLWDDRLAQRTSEESGDYIVKPFEIDVRETLSDGTNQGLFKEGETTDSGNTADESLLTLQISAGQGYVSGYRIETISPSYIDVEKPRIYEENTGAATSMEVGNYVRVNNTYNLPDVSGDSVQGITPFKEVGLFDTFTATGGSANGGKIGVSRIRAIEFDSGSQGQNDHSLDSETVFRMFLFDIKMFTQLSVSAAVETSHITSGALITGALSGAYGFVNSGSSGTELFLTSVTGRFFANEELISSASYETGSRITNSGGSTAVTLSTIKVNGFDKVKQLFMDDADANQDFTADLLLEIQQTVSGTITISTTDLLGFNSSFLSELIVGDQVLIPSGTAGAIEERFIATITSDTVATLSSSVTNAISSVGITRARSFINDQEKNVLIRKLAKDNIRSLLIDSSNNASNTSLEVRKQYVTTSDTSGIASLSAGANQTFNAESNLDYNISILSAGVTITQTPLAAGSVVNINSNKIVISGDGTNTVTFTAPDLFGNGAELKITATLNKSLVSAKVKTSNLSAKLRVTNKRDYVVGDGAMVYGTSAHHHEISTGVSDAYQILAVYDSGVTGTAAEGESAIISSASGVFLKGEYIQGVLSSAVAIVVTTSTPIQYVTTNGIAFQVGEQITGLTSAATATVDVVNSSDSDIVNSFLLDTGQRDNFYETSRLVLKNKSPAPAGDLLVVFDYFSHGSGDFFTVDSYNGVDYKNIPTYNATRIDPEVRNTKGQYDLRSCVDFRPRIADHVSVNAAGELSVSEATFDFESRLYSGAGSSKVDIVKDNSNFRYDFDYYLGRNSSLFLTQDGQFIVVDSYSAEEPQTPADVDNSMRIADIEMAPYVIDIRDVIVTEFSNKRYTMKDINLLEKRINNIEYYTALSLLEKDAETSQIKDANGLDRFKSGFLVDNFGGHKIGDTVHQDYRVAIDMEDRVLRPKFAMKNISLQETATTDTERLTAGYVVRGGIAMLPYTHQASISQQYGTRVENLNPVLSFFWEGSLNLIPESDEWFETNYLPAIRTNAEGNFNTIAAQNKNAIGTIWDSPVTQWTGVTTNRDVGGSIRSRRRSSVRGLATLQRVVTDERGISNSSGIQTSIVEQTDFKTLSDKIVSRSLIPFMREKDVYFEASGLKPLTQVFPFFDKIDVSRFCGQVSGSFVANSAATLLKAQSADWGSVSKVEVYYDNNANAAVTMRIETAREVDAGYGLTNPLTYWKLRGEQTTAAVRSVGQDVITFDAGNSTLLAQDTPLSPNDKGELYFRLKLKPAAGVSVAQGQIQIIEVVLYDQNGDVISNINNVEVLTSLNFVTPYNVFDTVDVNADVANKIVPFNSDRSTVGEAYVQATRSSNGFNHEIVARIIGGTFSIPTTSGNIKFTKAADVKSGVLISDAAGHVAGLFTIPNPNVTGNPKFQTGEREFRLTTSAEDTNSTESFAVSDFSSRGVLNNRQESIVAIRNARIVRQSVSRTTRVTRTRDAGLREIGWWDPLAQSILPVTEGGEYITKIDVFFSQKDGVIPVNLQLRPMENGTPTTTVMPGSNVTLNPEHVNISADGTVATTFEFATPIYVKSNVEIAIVLTSNSQKYLAWISRLGENDAATGAAVSEQPYLGVLFKSQNNSTWSPYDLEDLKFVTYRAVFDTSTAGVVTLNNADIPYNKLDINPLEMTAGSNIIKVFHTDHGMYGNNNYAQLSGVSNDIVRTTLAADFSDVADTLTLISPPAEFPASGNRTFKLYSSNVDENNSEVITADVSTSGSDLILSNIVRSVAGDQGTHYVGGVVEFYELNGIPLNEINETPQIISNKNIDYYTISVATNAVAESVSGGSNVSASNNAVGDSFQLMLPILEFPDTSVQLKSKFVSATSPSGSQPSFGILPESDSVVAERITQEVPVMIASGVNETQNLGSSKSCTVRAIIASNKDNVSPQIDLDRKSLTMHSNRIDNINSSADVYPANTFVSATAPDGDSSEAIYITKRVQLSTPATAIRVYLDAVRNASASIELMYKVLRSDDSTDFDEIGWSYFNTDGSPDELVSVVSNRTSFLEYKYTENDIPEFIAFAVKIKMKGTSGTEVPLIKDLRCIALAV